MNITDLSITVVGAEYPVNLGYIARLMKNFGLHTLYLVEPNCDMRAAGVYASHGVDILEGAKMVTLRKVRKTHDLLLGTTAIKARRSSNVNRTAMSPEEAVKRLFEAKSASLVFGRDTTGLTNEELKLCDLVTTIETHSDYKTLNVSHSAAILLYLTSRAAIERKYKSALSQSNASREKREMFAEQARRLAISAGIEGLKSERIAQVAGRVALKSGVTSTELGLLLTVLKKAEVAIMRGQVRSRT